MLAPPRKRKAIFPGQRDTPKFLRERRLLAINSIAGEVDLLGRSPI